MAQRNMMETEESVEEAAKEARDERSLRRRFKIAHYMLAPARWMCLGVCRALGLSFDMWMGEKGSPTIVDSMEAAHQAQSDNIITAFAMLMHSVTHHDGVGGGYFTLPKHDVMGASRFVNMLVLTSLSDEGKAALAEMLKLRAERRAKQDSTHTNESGDDNGTPV